MQECNHCGNQLEVILWYRKPYALQVFSSTINTVNTLFKMDTGGGVTAINGKAYEQQSLTPTPSKSFWMDTPCKASLSHKQRTSQQQVYVVDKLKRNMSTSHHSLKSCSLNQSNHIHRIVQPTETVPKYFQRPGNFSKQFIIKLKPDATPHALYKSHYIPLPLRPKYKKSLSEWSTWVSNQKLMSQHHGMLGRWWCPKEWLSSHVLTWREHTAKSASRSVDPSG